MEKITVYFSDGSKVDFHENQSLQTVKYLVDEKHVRQNKSASQSEIFTLWAHTHDGLIPSFLEVLANSEYFFDVKKPDIYYNSLAIVKIEK